MPADRFPLVSVLVLTYNHSAYIAACLKSLLAIDYPNLEIIILDDGSSDQTVSIAQDTARRCSTLTVHTQAHTAHTAENSQKLVTMARGEYCLFMAGDD